MKKISAILLGLTLVVSAFLINSNASVNYAESLNKKITKDRTLRRFSGGIRTRSSNPYQKKSVETSALNRRYGYIRPRITKKVETNSVSEQTTENRRTTFSVDNFKRTNYIIKTQTI